MPEKLEIMALKKSSVHMKDETRVMNLISSIIRGGKEKLQVVADFDNTLTRFMLNGTKCVGCHKALDESVRLSEEYRKKGNGLRAHYYPIEIDPKLTDEEKLPLMVEWWTQSHNLLIEYGLNKNDIEQIVKESNLYFRDGCKDYFDMLNESEVPLLVFSAGLGNIIEAAVKQQATLHENMKIVSNFMEFDSKGEILGFKGELIHSLNKHQSAIHKSDYFKHIEARENVILLGDSLGDLRMADGAANMKYCLSIGFLNDKIEERLSSYLDAYDIVLVSDETMDIPHAILEKIV